MFKINIIVKDIQQTLICFILKGALLFKETTINSAKYFQETARIST